MYGTAWCCKSKFSSFDKLSSICHDLSDEVGTRYVRVCLLGWLLVNSLCSMAIPTFHPEYGRFMLESTPGSPYTGSLSDLISVEDNMRYR